MVVPILYPFPRDRSRDRPAAACQRLRRGSPKHQRAYPATLTCTAGSRSRRTVASALAARRCFAASPKRAGSCGIAADRLPYPLPATLTCCRAMLSWTAGVRRRRTVARAWTALSSRRSACSTRRARYSPSPRPTPRFRRRAYSPSAC